MYATINFIYIFVFKFVYCEAVSYAMWLCHSMSSNSSERKVFNRESLILFCPIFLLRVISDFNLSESFLGWISWGCGCSTAVEHSAAEQNSWGRGFESCRVLGFSLPSSSFNFFLLSTNGVSLIRSHKRRCISDWVLVKKYNKNEVLPGTKQAQ